MTGYDLTTTTDGSGTSWFPESSNGSIAITPSAAGYDFRVAGGSNAVVKRLTAGFCTSVSTAAAGALHAVPTGQTDQNPGCSGNGIAYVPLPKATSRDVRFEVACPHDGFAGTSDIYLFGSAANSGTVELTIDVALTGPGSTIGAEVFGNAAAPTTADTFTLPDANAVRTFTWMAKTMPACDVPQTYIFRVTRNVSDNNIGEFLAHSVIVK